MTGIPGRMAVMAAAALFALTAGLSVRDGGGSAFARDAAAGAQLDEIQRGDAIFKASCQACHDRRRVDVQALSYDAWVATIRKMIGKGAEIAEDDVPVLAEYLSIFNGPVPDGPGREILLNTCTMCHDLMRIKLGRRTAEEWEEALITMLNEGAPLSDPEFDVIHQYLSQNFNVE